MQAHGWRRTHEPQRQRDLSAELVISLHVANLEVARRIREARREQNLVHEDEACDEQDQPHGLVAQLAAAETPGAVARARRLCAAGNKRQVLESVGRLSCKCVCVCVAR